MAKLLVEKKLSEHDRLLREISYHLVRLEKYNEESEKFNELFKLEMKEFKEEMRISREKSDKEMKEFKEEMKEFKDEMNKFRDEAEKDRRKFNRDLADIAKKMGTIVEDIVVPNIENLAERYFNLHEVLDFMVRRKKTIPGDPRNIREFDIIAVYENKVILNETKSTAKMDYVNEFIEFIESNKFYDYFPEYKDKMIIPIFSSLCLPDNIIKYLSKKNIYAMAMKDDTMDILNYDEVKSD